MQDIIRCTYGVEVRAVANADGTEDRSIDVVASTDAVDSHGDVVVQDFILGRYKANPVVLWGHDSWSLPIGYSDPVDVVDGKLKARLHFVDAKANPKADAIWEGFKQRSIRAVSIGFRPGLVVKGQRDGRDVYMLSANELVEISVVTIGSNPDALAERSKSLESLVTPHTITAPARAEEQEPMNMKAIIAALALAETATETEVLDRVKALLETEKSLLATAGKATSSESLGVVKAWQLTASQHDAIVADNTTLKQAAYDRERAEIIAKGKAEHKVTPAVEKVLGDIKDNASIKALVESLPVIPALERAAKLPDEAPPEVPAAVAELVAGKKWEDLAPMQKHKLLELHPETYETLKAAHDARKSQPTHSSRQAGAR